MNITDERVLDMAMNLSRNEWDEFISSLDESSIAQIEKTASSLSVLCAEIAEYTGQRGGYGCFDSGHEKALREAQKIRKRIRRGLGYLKP